MKQSKKPYGADHREACPKCGDIVYVARRSPHPVVIEGEKQVLQCIKCDYETTRTVNKDGELI